ncbi:MAG: hypothetical protein AAB899_03585 [Patescibacteria group bacterium]
MKGLSHGILPDTRSYEKKLYNDAMTVDALIMLAGAFVAVLPFLGFPNSWDTALFFLAGIFIISLGIAVRRREAHSVAPEQKKKEAAFADVNTPSSPHENA